jgi:hypothetical protein
MSPATFQMVSTQTRTGLFAVGASDVNRVNFCVFGQAAMARAKRDESTVSSTG